jgi:hypothetical protein
VLELAALFFGQSYLVCFFWHVIAYSLVRRCTKYAKRFTECGCVWWGRISNGYRLENHFRCRFTLEHQRREHHLHGWCGDCGHASDPSSVLELDPSKYATVIITATPPQVTAVAITSSVTRVTSPQTIALVASVIGVGPFNDAITWSVVSGGGSL